jgi:hypothetical protein
MGFPAKGPLLTAVAGRERPHPADVWGHAAKDYDAGRTGELQTKTDFGTERDLEKCECLRSGLKKRRFWGFEILPQPSGRHCIQTLGRNIAR